ncbi:phospholipase D-like domain-containing protein [Sulfurimonas sp.]|uniref:phospholipase D-like domain-containing protein n=1 Tax=Sulfurimonas sp. TaxID=2022749 RepID=UPI0025D235CB|nr:phospholipase D-like domain-containing protein [Sulfurimonas sp.]MBW6488344.1 NgoFVII family restriction endonuclease [Sulfurimonas sp.]
MQILSSAKEIARNICDCITKFENISMSVAWASASSEAFKLLIDNKKKIKFSTVGLHFYQTHPDFIKEFLDDERVRFYKQENGIFHPKIYLFWNDDNDWICLSGSANFTQSALSKNSEVMTMFNSKDGNNFTEIKNIIDNYYKKAEIFKKEDLQGYQNVWNQKNIQKQNLDDFSPNVIQNPLYKSPILSLSWDEYYSLLLEKGNHLDERLRLLTKVREYFNQNSFEKMTEIQRKNIAGANKISDGIKDWRLFGRMPIPAFLGRLAPNDPQLQYISDSLKLMPLDGEVSFKNYNEFLYYFKMADKFFKDIDNKFEKAGWGYGVSPITRLLSMKRPDEFFCLTGANQPNLMKNFGIKRDIIKAKSYERYWDEIIEPVRQSPWYNSDKPTNKEELKAWNGRVALMDALFYLE